MLDAALKCFVSTYGGFPITKSKPPFSSNTLLYTLPLIFSGRIYFNSLGGHLISISTSVFPVAIF